MKLTKGQKIWSIIAAIVAMSAVGIYIIKPGKEKKKNRVNDTDTDSPSQPSTSNNVTSGDQRIQSATTNATNVNLRSSASSSSNSNIIRNVAEKGKYLGSIIEYIQDEDGDQHMWAHIKPQFPFTILTSPFYVRTDLIKVS